MQDCKGTSTPMEIKLSLVKTDDKDIIGELEYQSLVGSIMYGMLGKCQYLAYSISTLSKFNSCPGSEHHEAAKRVLRYLQKTGSYGLMYKGGDVSSFPEPRCYTNTDWAGKPGAQKSTAGYVFILAEAAVSWKTKRQSVVAQSTMEAEYVALSEAVKESI